MQRALSFHTGVFSTAARRLSSTVAGPVDWLHDGNRFLLFIRTDFFRTSVQRQKGPSVFCLVDKMEPFDTDSFIAEIQTEPAIWDYKSDSYSNRIAKAKAWEKICGIVHDNFQELSGAEKNNIGKCVIILLFA